MEAPRDAMPAWFERLRPAASARTHLLLAALLWTVVGSALAVAGARFLVAGAPGAAPFALPLAGLLGALKARFVLRKTAARTVRRIHERGDGRCVGGFLSWRSWLLVLGMAVLGRVLRSGLVPDGVLGALYVAVGVALVVASAALWGAWRAARTPPS